MTLAVLDAAPQESSPACESVRRSQHLKRREDSPVEEYATMALRVSLGLVLGRPKALFCLEMRQQGVGQNGQLAGTIGLR